MQPILLVAKLNVSHEKKLLNIRASVLATFRCSTFNAFVYCNLSFIELIAFLSTRLDLNDVRFLGRIFFYILEGFKIQNNK